MSKISTDKEKILQYLEFKGISKYSFSKKTGLAQAFLNSGNSLGLDKLRIILDNYDDLNPEWLLTGKGSMLKECYSNNSGIQNHDNNNHNQQIVNHANGKNIVQKNTVKSKAIETQEEVILKDQLGLCRQSKELLEQQIIEKDIQIKEKDKQIEQKDLQIKEKDSQIKEKDTQIKEKDKQIEKLFNMLST